MKIINIAKPITKRKFMLCSIQLPENNNIKLAGERTLVPEKPALLQTDFSLRDTILQPFSGPIRLK